MDVAQIAVEVTLRDFLIDLNQRLDHGGVDRTEMLALIGALDMVRRSRARSEVRQKMRSATRC